MKNVPCFEHGGYTFPSPDFLNDPLMHVDCVFIIMKDVGIFLRGNHQKQRLDVIDLLLLLVSHLVGLQTSQVILSPLLAGDNCQAVLCPDPLSGRVGELKFSTSFDVIVTCVP